MQTVYFSSVYSKQTTVASGNLKLPVHQRILHGNELTDRVFGAKNVLFFSGTVLELNNFLMTQNNNRKMRGLYLYYHKLLYETASVANRGPTCKLTQTIDMCHFLIYLLTPSSGAGQEQIQLLWTNSYLQWSPASGKKPFWKAWDMAIIKSIFFKQLMYEPFVQY